MKRFLSPMILIFALAVMLPTQFVQAGSNTFSVSTPVDRVEVASDEVASPCPTDVLVAPGPARKIAGGQVGDTAFSFDVCFPSHYGTVELGSVSVTADASLSTGAALTTLRNASGYGLNRIAAYSPSYTGSGSVYLWIPQPTHSVYHGTHGIVTVPSGSWQTITFESTAQYAAPGYFTGDVCLGALNYSYARGSGVISERNGFGTVCSELVVSN